MTRAFFVTGTDTEIGKTTITAALTHWAAQAGRRSVAVKPVAAGQEAVVEAWPEAAFQLLQPAPRRRLAPKPSLTGLAAA